MKVKTLKKFLWANNMPVFEGDTIYDVTDEIGELMIKHGYSVLAEEQKAEKAQPKVKKIDSPENKMMDTSAESNKKANEKDPEVNPIKTAKKKHGHKSQKRFKK